MIHHINGATMKAPAAPGQTEGVLESRRGQGRPDPAVRSFAVGRDHGGDHTYGAVSVVERLDGLLARLTPPTTCRADHLGLHPVERPQIFDAGGDDPDLDAGIQEPHRRRNELDPQLAGMLAEVPACTGSGVDD